MYAYNKGGVIAYASIAIALCIIITKKEIQNYVNFQHDENNLISDLDDENSMKSIFDNKDFNKYEFYFTVVSQVLNILVHICLLIGAFKRFHQFLVPYLLTRLVAWAILIVAMLFLLFMVPYVLFILVIMLIGLAIDVAIWIGVYGFYKQLKDEKHNVKNNEIENKLFNLPPTYEKV